MYNWKVQGKKYEIKRVEGGIKEGGSFVWATIVVTLNFEQQEKVPD